MKKDSTSFGEYIEKYKFYIGAALIVLILVGSGILLVRENNYKVSRNSDLKSQNEKISNLERNMADLERKIEESKNVPEAAQNQSSSNDSQGQVAGAAISENKNNVSVSGKININTASETELDTLPGIGPVYAGRIVEYRNANGGFKSVDEIVNVKGIGPKTLEKLRDHISVN